MVWLRIQLLPLLALPCLCQLTSCNHTHAAKGGDDAAGTISRIRSTCRCPAGQRYVQCGSAHASIFGACIFDQGERRDVCLSVLSW